jgi:hypothetical protein
MYREDYARAGLPMLPVVDPHGVLTSRKRCLWAATLLPVSELPFLLGMSGADLCDRGTRAGHRTARARHAVPDLAHRPERTLALLRVDHVPPAALDRHGRRPAAMNVDLLPHLNAALNAASAVLL